MPSSFAKAPNQVRDAPIAIGMQAQEQELWRIRKVESALKCLKLFAFNHRTPVSSRQNFFVGPTGTEQRETEKHSITSSNYYVRRKFYGEWGEES